jgi:paraquat-inducible protein A
MTATAKTARELSLVACHDCRLLVRCHPASVDETYGCPRCGATLHRRKANAISRTWALTLAASIFYLPANLLPISEYNSLTGTQYDTILSGVIYFIQSGMWPIALVIFVASVFVPLLKLALLIFLMISVQLKLKWRPRDRTVIYRITETIGRWSMVDIYAITVAVALVKFGFIADFEVGPGAIFFAAVVVITMLAANSFDPRLIWDKLE